MDLKQLLKQTKHQSYPELLYQFTPSKKEVSLQMNETPLL